MKKIFLDIIRKTFNNYGLGWMSEGLMSFVIQGKRMLPDEAAALPAAMRETRSPFDFRRLVEALRDRCPKFTTELLALRNATTGPGFLVFKELPIESPNCATPLCLRAPGTELVPF